MTDISLLPSNSRPIERELATLTARLESIAVPFNQIWNADTCPVEYLPFLAFAWSVDEWNDNWTVETQRAVVKNSIAVHQRKGTLGAVKRALAVMNYDTSVIEWFEKNPKGTPGTFSISVNPANGIITDSVRQIRAVVDAVKRLSAHYDIYFGTTVTATIAAYAVPAVGVEITITNTTNN
ncbi:phage tail protein I [Psychrobacter sp. 72-O-c]|uniref:phage tail protein I n=1 Tax=Psychrobacter sp. 72-O-c TaxID=2774125 RepID=UPI001918388D|nr:phage tail protein I [Psychrobacter sp. 72-O-c]